MKFPLTRHSRFGQLGLALVAGEAAAVVIWLAGAPEMSWLGFVAAGLAWSGGRARCRRQRSASASSA